MSPTTLATGGAWLHGKDASRSWDLGRGGSRSFASTSGCRVTRGGKPALAGAGDRGANVAAWRRRRRPWRGRTEAPRFNSFHWEGKEIMAELLHRGDGHEEVVGLAETKEAATELFFVRHGRQSRAAPRLRLSEALAKLPPWSPISASSRSWCPHVNLLWPLAEKLVTGELPGRPMRAHHS